jgi:hypothetical protein
MDEHVNAVIENGLNRTNFTLIILARTLADAAWSRWSIRKNVIIVTESRCSNKGILGQGHNELWSFERICKEV